MVHARGVIPNEMGSARCRATPALNQSADETRTPASRGGERVWAHKGAVWGLSPDEALRLI